MKNDVKQLDLISKSEAKTFSRLTHGGSNLNNKKGKRKTKRPILKNKSVHIVLKSKIAVGKLSLFHQDHYIKNLLKKRSKKDFFQILDYVNMGNHLHLHLKPYDVTKFKSFLRVFSGLIARQITNARKGNSFGKFWSDLVYSRVLLTSFEILSLKGYFKANRIEKSRDYKQRQMYWLEFLDYLHSKRRFKPSSVLIS